MEATLETPGGLQQAEQTNPTVSEKELPEQKPDSKITRLITKFRRAKSPDAALQEIVQYDPNQTVGEKIDAKNTSQGIKDKILAAFGRLKNNASPDEVLSQIANTSENVEQNEVDSQVAKEMTENAHIFAAAVTKMKEYAQSAKDNPYAIATILVPTALVALEKMVGIPLPKEIVEILPGGVGGGMAGYAMAPEKRGVKGKIAGVVVGTVGGIGATEALGHIPTGGPTELASSFVDDGVTAVVKPVASVAKRLRKPM